MQFILLQFIYKQFTLPHIYIYLKYGAGLTSIHQAIYFIAHLLSFKVWCGFIVHTSNLLTSNLFTSNLFYGLIVRYDEFLQYTDQD
ncbi:unnamed protein product [Prunus brigantina]